MIVKPYDNSMAVHVFILLVGLLAFPTVDNG